jgi:uncharacterized membrane protein
VTARLRKFLSDLAETFWLLPAAMVVGGIVLALLFVALDRSELLPDWLPAGWLYNGGGTGARTLLGAIASSTIGVAGTVFSITIAALSLAAGQMGPRLLRNFTRDRGVQVTLGAFLGTFSFSLVTLRSVRVADEGSFVPHLALTVAILMAFGCVATLVYFVHHMANRINVDTVVDLVGDEMRAAILRLTLDKPEDNGDAGGGDWSAAEPVVHRGRGYLQQLDKAGLADWAAERNVTIRLLVRPGDYIFPGAAAALVFPEVEGAAAAIGDATALGARRVSSADLEFAIRQLVEVAARALSPGINDPQTAISVLDQLGAALCDMASRHLPSGVVVRNGRPVLFVPEVDYDGLTDSIFDLIRQNAGGSTAVLVRMLDMLTAVATCEGDAARLVSLCRHADLILAEGERTIGAPADRAHLRQRYDNFERVRLDGPAAMTRGRVAEPAAG